MLFSGLSLGQRGAALCNIRRSAGISEANEKEIKMAPKMDLEFAPQNTDPIKLASQGYIFIRKTVSSVAGDSVRM